MDQRHDFQKLVTTAPCGCVADRFRKRKAMWRLNGNYLATQHVSRSASVVQTSASFMPAVSTTFEFCTFNTNSITLFSSKFYRPCTGTAGDRSLTLITWKLIKKVNITHYFFSVHLALIPWRPLAIAINNTERPAVYWSLLPSFLDKTKIRYHEHFQTNSISCW